MPARPAWPPKSLPRLFVRDPLGEGGDVDLDAAQANYLGNVLRLGRSGTAHVRRQSGEWLAQIAEAGKKRMTLTVERRTREAETVPDVWLAFAPGETGADGLAGGESDRARRRAADPGDDAADGRRTREARTARSHHDRGCGAMRADRPARDRGAGGIARNSWTYVIASAPSISPTRAAGSRQPTAFKPGPALILTGPEGGFTDEERADDPRCAERRRHFARPAHPPRRNRRAGSARRLYGGGG